MASSESKTYVLIIGSSSKSSRTSSDPLSKDKSASGPRVAKLGIEDRVTTSKYPSFTAYERAIKGLLAEVTGGAIAEEVLLV